MNPTDVLDKAEKGLEEIKSRKYKLHSKTRMLLLLIDGHHTYAELNDQAGKIGLPAGTLDDLIAQSFVRLHAAPAAAPAPAEGAAPASGGHYEQYRAARGFMNETIVNALGLKSFLFTLKIEKTGNLDDLRKLFEDYSKAMNKALGEQTAGVFIIRMKSLLR